MVCERTEYLGADAAGHREPSAVGTLRINHVMQRQQKDRADSARMLMREAHDGGLLKKAPRGAD
jgi:hypothetical protein